MINKTISILSKEEKREISTIVDELRHIYVQRNFISLDGLDRAKEE